MDRAPRNRRDDNRAWPDAAIGELAGRQATMISHRQLRSLGVSASHIDHARRWGRLHPVHHGVFSLVAPGARPRLAAEHAARLAIGPRAVLSHRTAAWLHGLRPSPPDEVELTIVGGDRGRRRAGLRVHRTTVLHPGQLVRVGQMPVTSVARTAVDLIRELDGRAAERFVEEALRRTSRSKLEEAVARHPRRPGIGRLVALLDPDRPSSDTWSDPEESLLALVRRAELPAPEANVPVGRYRPDLVWRAERLIVEYDSDLFHDGVRPRRRDASRHNDLESWGWHVIHVTADELYRHPERLIARIAAALARHPG